MNEIDPTTVRLSLKEERRTERMVGLVTRSTLADWKIIQIKHGLSVGDLDTLAVKLIKDHPNILKKNYELREKE